MSPEEMIECLKSSTSAFGSLGSQVFMNKCYITLKSYEDWSEDNVDFFQSHVEGSFMQPPMNLLYYNIENEWALPCFKMLYRMHHNVIPHSIDNRFHNLPKIVNIPRSNGSQSKSMVVSSDYGIKIKKSKAGELTRLCLRVHWFDETDKTEGEQLSSIAENVYGTIFKDVYLEDIVRLNPNVKKDGIVFTFNSIPIDNAMTQMQIEVINYCNGKQKRWCENVLQPVLDDYKSRNVVHINYKII